MIKPNEVPQQLLDKLRQEFEADGRIRNLRIQQDLAARKGNFALGLSIGKQIEKLYTLCVQSYMEETEKECADIDLATVDLPEDDRTELLELIITLFLAADIIDTATRDFNDVLHRTDKTYDMVQFDDIRQFASKAKAKLDYFAKHSDFLQDVAFGDKSDNMYQLLRNKARALMRRKGGKDVAQDE